MRSWVNRANAIMHVSGKIHALFRKHSRRTLMNYLTGFEEVRWSQQWDRCRGKLSGQETENTHMELIGWVWGHAGWLCLKFPGGHPPEDFQGTAGYTTAQKGNALWQEWRHQRMEPWARGAPVLLLGKIKEPTEEVSVD